MYGRVHTIQGELGKPDESQKKVFNHTMAGKIPEFLPKHEKTAQFHCNM